MGDMDSDVPIPIYILIGVFAFLELLIKMRTRCYNQGSIPTNDSNETRREVNQNEFERSSSQNPVGLGPSPTAPPIRLDVTRRQSSLPTYEEASSAFVCHTCGPNTSGTTSTQSNQNIPEVSCPEGPRPTAPPRLDTTGRQSSLPTYTEACSVFVTSDSRDIKPHMNYGYGHDDTSNPHTFQEIYINSSLVL